MKLDDTQLETYERDGVLFLPELFAPDEIEPLRREIDRVVQLDREELFRGDDGQVHAIWALEGYSDLFRRLLHHPRLVEPAKQLLGPDIYHHQLKVVCKAPFQGNLFPWHHDYGSWVKNDGMRRPEALNIALYLDEITEYNGPLSYIPRSYNAGEGGSYLPTLSFEESGNLLPVVDRELLMELVGEHGIYGPKGPAGSAVLFHACTVHGSTPNMSADTRYVVYLTFNPIDNALVDPNRPWFMANPDPQRIDSLPDDCLR